MKLGNLATGSDFFGRDTEREDFWRFIEDNHLVLSGPRRLGKSSLINRLCEEAEQHGLLARHIDVQDITTCEQFLAALDQAFPDTRLQAYLAAASGKAGQWLKRLRKFEAKLPGGIGGIAIELDNAKATSWRETAGKLDAFPV